jgi:hypothetical protein
MLLKKIMNEPLQERFWKSKIQLQKKIVSMHTKIPRVKKTGHLLHILPFIHQKTRRTEEERKYIALVPRSQEQLLKDEIQHLVDFGVLRKVSRFEWACPRFTVGQPDKSLRSLADLREFDKRKKENPYKVNDLLQN